MCICHTISSHNPEQREGWQCHEFMALLSRYIPLLRVVSYIGLGECLPETPTVYTTFITNAMRREREISIYLPVVPHKAVAEVSKIGNL